MDFEITGEETQEQLEELMAKMGDIEVEGDIKEQEERAEHSDSETSETVQTDTGDKKAPTPGAGTDEEGQPQEDVKGILTRDGKHVIPYDVPCPLMVQPDRQKFVIMYMIVKIILFHFCAWRSARFHAVPSPVY
ncbi:hypothetical protein [Salmonella enterica]|uniref:hypothetical protein n=1 Tax=Salmonella enterica TaxID=28901 RepID=UPI003453BBA1